MTVCFFVKRTNSLDGDSSLIRFVDLWIQTSFKRKCFLAEFMVRNSFEMTSSCTTTPRGSNLDEDTLAPDDLTDFEDDEEVFGDEQVIYPKVFITPTTR